MRNFRDTFKTQKRLFISDFSICMTVHLSRRLTFGLPQHTVFSAAD